MVGCGLSLLANAANTTWQLTNFRDESGTDCDGVYCQSWFVAARASLGSTTPAGQSRFIAGTGTSLSYTSGLDTCAVHSTCVQHRCRLSDRATGHCRRYSPRLATSACKRTIPTGADARMENF